MKKLLGFTHGVNLGGWLSQCDHTKERYDTFIVEDDIKEIKSWGLDHIRVPVDYNLVEDEEGNYLEEGFAYIQKAIDWAGKYGLNMVLDLHKTYGYSFDAAEEESGFFDNEAYQERFYKLWDQFASRYGKYSDRLAFEILNEVTDKEYSDTWNRISGECIQRIRKFAPDIKILIGGYYNNSIEALKDLSMPVDENIVYNFHCYEPLIFTHQGGWWVPGMDTSFRMPFDVPYSEYTKMLMNIYLLFLKSLINIILMTRLELNILRILLARQFVLLRREMLRFIVENSELLSLQRLKMPLNGINSFVPALINMILQEPLGVIKK